MRIAVWHNLPSGGGKRALWFHVKGLLARGHQVESWCPSTASPDYLPLNRLCTEHVIPFKRDGKFQGSLGIWRLIKEMDANCREAARQMAEKKFDVLLANSCFFFAAPPIGRHVKIPSAIYHGEPHREFYEAMPKLLWLTMTQPGRGLRGSRIARMIANEVRLHSMRTQALTEIDNAGAFNRILVNSLYSRETMLRAYGLDSQVCYLGVDSDQFRPTGESLSDYVIGLGAFGYQKGLDRAIKALGAIPAKSRPRLVWVGNARNPKYMAEVDSLANSHGVVLEPKFLVSDEELVSLLSRARAMIYTSRLEPFGLAPLEANACGVPVVAIAEGGVKESIENGRNGILVENADPATLAAAIMSLLDNSTSSAKMRQTSRECVVQKWSLDAGISRLESALLRLLEPASRN